MSREEVAAAMQGFEAGMDVGESIFIAACTAYMEEHNLNALSITDFMLIKEAIASTKLDRGDDGTFGLENG